MKVKASTPSWSLFAILQKHAPATVRHSPSSHKKPVIPPPATQPQSRQVQPRTISDIAAIDDKSAGNEILIDEFGDDYVELSLAGESTVSEEVWTRAAPIVRRSSAARSTPQPSVNIDFHSSSRPDFDDICEFSLCGKVPMNVASSPSLTDVQFYGESPISHREDSNTGLMSPVLSEQTQKVDPAEIDEKLQELLAICRPLSSVVLEDQGNAEDLLLEVTNKLRYVKEERNVLKAKLILKFLSEYRRYRRGNHDPLLFTPDPSDLTEHTVKVNSANYFYTPSDTKKPIPSESPEKLSQTRRRLPFTRTQKLQTRSKSPVVNRKNEARQSPLRAKTPTRLNFPKKKETLLARIATPSELVARLAQ